MNYCSNCSSPVQVIYEDSFKRFHCDSCGTTFYLNPKPCVTAVLINDNKEILLSKRTIEPGRNKWDLIGGFMETQEDPYEALKREVKEELGTRVGNINLIGFVMDKYGEEDFHTLNIAFTCNLIETPIINSMEFSEIKWFKVEDLPNPKTYAFKNVKKIIDLYLEKFTH